MESSTMIWMLVAAAPAVWHFVLRPTSSNNLPPGTMGWPLLGEFVSFYFRPEAFIAKRREKKDELSEQIKSIMKERKKNMSSYDSLDDLLSSMLKEAEEKEDGDFEISTFQIVDFIVSLLFVTLETTPKAVSLAVRRLSENPQIIQELREEHEAIRRTKRNNESLSWDDCKSMTLTKDVIKETIRLGTGRIYNMLMKKTFQNVEMKGYKIPKGWTCLLFHEVCNLDTNYYEDPLTFNPRRWQTRLLIVYPVFPLELALENVQDMTLLQCFFQFSCIILSQISDGNTVLPISSLRWLDSSLLSIVDSIV